MKQGVTLFPVSIIKRGENYSLFLLKLPFFYLEAHGYFTSLASLSLSLSIYLFPFSWAMENWLLGQKERERYTYVQTHSYTHTNTLTHTLMYHILTLLSFFFLFSYSFWSFLPYLKTSGCAPSILGLYIRRELTRGQKNIITPPGHR